MCAAHCAPLPSLGQVIYMVLCDYEIVDEEGQQIGLAWAEREACRTNRADTMHDIRTGELPNVKRVIEIEFIPDSGVMNSRDVTEDFVFERPDFVDDIKAYRQELEFDHARKLRVEA